METSIARACPSFGKCHCHNNIWEDSLHCDYECHADAARWPAPHNPRELKYNKKSVHRNILCDIKISLYDKYAKRSKYVSELSK